MHGPLVMTATAILPQVTRVSWSGPQFAINIKSSARRFDVRLREGVIPFTSVNGRPAQGYMVHLPPDALLDLVVAADAEGENSLAVIEFDSDGTPTGRRISFSNMLADQPAGEGARTRFGPIGTWVERNNGSRSKYYCFTSVHKLLNQAEDDSWQVSRLSVLLDEEHLAHIGWDDSGLAHPDKPAERQIPDLDYDDLSATIRIYRSNLKSVSQRPGIRILAGNQTATGDDTGRSNDPQFSPGTGAAFPMTVGTRESVIVKVTNRFRTPTTIVLVDKSSGQVCWSYNPSGSTSLNSGACAVENTALDLRNFVVIGRRHVGATAASGSWQELKPLVQFEREAFVSLVFDEGPDDADYDDVKVDILTMPHL
jgi:hypothetical protein